jgi:glycosyltransferase involved in cell wall biosynthesis
MKTAFWISFGFTLYVYLLYPVAIWLASKIRPQRAGAVSPEQRVRVSVCIAARNEAARLPRKIDNLRAQDYPQDLLEIVVASDGSTDQTLALLRADDRVTALDCPARGKAATINCAVAAARGSVLVLCDVRQTFNRGAISALVERLRDPAVGVVSGELIHLEPDSNVEASIGLYWRYEKWIRRAESAYFSTVGATGALYAMRTADFVPLRAGTILDDFDEPMAVIRTGKRAVLDADAKAYDVLETNIASERRRKTRTLAGNWQSLITNPWLLNPASNPVWWQYLSHKVARLLVPFALIVMLPAAFTAASVPYHMFAVAQMMFWGCALAGSAWPAIQRFRPIGLASTFLELNAAAVIGLLYFSFGAATKLWNR